MRVAVIASVMLLAACQGERDPNGSYTTSGKYIGSNAFHEIGAAESHVYSLGTPDPIKKREVQRLNDRYSERITFTNNSVMVYQKLFYGGFATDQSDTELLQALVDDRWFQEKSIVYDEKAVKRGRGYLYLVQQSPTHTCFAFRGFFGLAPDGRGARGDEEMRGSVCYQAAYRTTEALESEMNTILSRIRFDDGSYNKAHAAKAASP